MPVKIRLQRRGRRKSPFYHIVVADARAPRDGRFIEKLGTYNPMTKPATIELNRDSAYEWLMKGAQPTDTARAILRFKGVMYRKHLMRGVKKGALTEEQAMAKYQEWIDVKEAKIAERRAETAEEIRKYHERINGKAPVVKAAPVKSELLEGSAKAEEPKSFADGVEQTTVESLSGEAPVVEEKVEETAAPAAEKVVEKVEEAAPVVEEKVEETAAPAAEKIVEKVEEAAPVVEEKVEETAPVVEETAAPAAEKVEEKVEEAAPVVEEKVEVAAAPVVEEVVKAAPVTTEGDDLKIIEGIGPKIAETLNNAGINTFAQLAETPADKVKEILAAATPSLASHDPATWGKQAQMAANGEWADLKKWQDELDGGKVVK